MLKISGKTKSRVIQSQLKKWGFEHVQNKNSEYWMREEDKHWRKIRRWSNKYQLLFQKIDKRYVRSTSYRQTFLSNNKGIHNQGKEYRCAYCGKKIKVQNMEVDHLISCKAAESTHFSKWALKAMGAKSVNDPKNLVPACFNCNRKKGADQGIWVLKGLLGRHSFFWIFPKVAITLLFVAGAIGFFWLYFPH